MATVNGSQNKNFSAAALVSTGVGVWNGIVINSHSSGTIKVIDGLTAGSGRIILNTYTLPSGSQVISFPNGAAYTTGLFIDTAGTTVNYTVSWNGPS